MNQTDQQRDRTVDREGYETVELGALVVGAGAAGARAAIELAERGVDTEEFLVIGKRAHGDAHTTWARGGVNGALGTHDPEDDWTVHAADTLNEGHHLNDPAKVEAVTREMPDRLRELDDWGMPYSRTEDGDIDQRYFGAQSFRRTAFAGDHTGESMLNTLIDRAQDLGVRYREDVLITRLVTDDDGRVLGAVGYDMEDGHQILFDTDAVVLAAGGFAGSYGRHTSRDDENTGDGPALAYEAGAILLDMEFVQFHPTGMAVDEDDPEWAPWAGRLVTEAVRGEGGRLFNSEGERFMERYSPDQMELAARDVVARAIAREVEEGRGTDRGGVYLDISHEPREFIAERLPRMYERFADLGVDMAEEPVEVAPTAHYGMGGVAVNDVGESEVDGLYAVGETMGGVHGANRLGGNSLAETLAFGRIAGADLAARLRAGDLPPRDRDTLHERAADHFADLDAITERDGDEDPAALLEELRALLDEHAGILRDEAGLRAGLARLDRLRERAADLDTGSRAGGRGDDADRSVEYAVNLGFALTVAESVLRSALERTESRGAHFRTDHGETDDDWRVNVRVRRDAVGAMSLSTSAVDEPSDAVTAALDRGYELDYHQLE
ncbi:L-aspartate oxidase [Halobaculum lipolyticum]|uniref:L-aspartate oxidase n=1 Tax=Halobaculum lipolyticum TaxID=3032001 RepID=A0ABD5W5N3_9EURY|nr:FAD-dependent oxidoreductase [Halobaculum sp. DT31]